MKITHIPTIVHIVRSVALVGQRQTTAAEFARYVHDGINGPDLTDAEEESYAKMGYEFEPGHHCLRKKCGCLASWHMPWTGPGSPRTSYFKTCGESLSQSGLDADYMYWQSVGAGIAACCFATAGEHCETGPHPGEQNAAFYLAGLPYDDKIILRYVTDTGHDPDYFSEKNCRRFRGRNTVAVYAAMRLVGLDTIPYSAFLGTDIENVLPFIAMGRFTPGERPRALADYKTYMEYRGS